MPLSTFYGLAELGADVTLRVHTHVREDQIALFGFATALEQQLFERLIGVSGIGPKIALAALSGIEPAELVRAVRPRDIARLTSIPGIGKKTAERIALELRDRLPPRLAPSRARRRRGRADADLRGRPAVGAGQPRLSARRGGKGGRSGPAGRRRGAFEPFEHGSCCGRRCENRSWSQVAAMGF